MSWFKRETSPPPSAPAVPASTPLLDPGAEQLERMRVAVRDLHAAVADLEATVKSHGRQLDDLDDNLRRFKGRRSKQDALEAPAPEPEPPPRLPTIHQLRQAGRLPFK